MADELRVYLDHLIPRESLRYRRPAEQVLVPESHKNLAISALRDSERVKFLRKPDFQRETWAWSPEDCVSLLESLVNDQVIPSIIMWSSPENGYDYILDGGHRVSVLLAWLRDDWGDMLPREGYRDDQHEELAKKAAREVRRLVKERIGDGRDYELAETKITQVMMEGDSPQKTLPAQVFKRGVFFQRLLKGYIDLHVLWVNGNYEKAEQSFLKINKSGRQLSDWEIKLIDNRNSSFARVLMSVASISSAKYYWPIGDPSVNATPEMQAKVQKIVGGIESIYAKLFRPNPEDSIRSLRQPLFVVTGPQQRPYYLAELLTVIRGGRGQVAETERLLAQDKAASPEQIIESGFRLVTDTEDALDHLVGESNNPKSLAIVPAVYFYTMSGRYVRSMLYGWLYWLLNGANEDVIRDRKRVFSAHRAAFEQVLLDRGGDIVSGLSRRTGSGPEITVQTSLYFEGLLRLLQKHGDEIHSQAFQIDYGDLTRSIINRSPKPPASEQGRSRAFTDRQRSTVVLQELLRNPPRCGICGGILDLMSAVQFDHREEFAKGGQTVVQNARLSHPFCNNPRNRTVIEDLRAGRATVELPVFVEASMAASAGQLSFFDDPSFNP